MNVVQWNPGISSPLVIPPTPFKGGGGACLAV